MRACMLAVCVAVGCAHESPSLPLRDAEIVFPVYAHAERTRGMLDHANEIITHVCYPACASAEAVTNGSDALSERGGGGGGSAAGRAAF